MVLFCTLASCQNNNMLRSGYEAKQDTDATDARITVNRFAEMTPEKIAPTKSGL